MTFSQRYGHKQVRSTFQVDSMDTPLRNGLWNALTTTFSPPTIDLVNNLWSKFYKKPLDVLTPYYSVMGEWPSEIKKLFFACPWHEVYDFLEFVAKQSFPHNKSLVPSFKAACDAVMVEELAGYRFAGNVIAPLPSEHEISGIEAALAATAAPSPLHLVNTHLNQALVLLSNKTAPDYRNSIKESISAIECICKLIAKKPNATLSPALDAIQKPGQLHPTLVDGFKKLYGFTSDASGIRHALKDAPTVDIEDAKYMLVSCAGFVSYLIDKARKAGIAL